MAPSRNVASPPPPTACNPAADIGNPNGSHVGCFTNALTGAREYTGPAQCVACHEADARNMHGSLHYQQNGPTDFVTNIAGNAGEGPADRPVILPNQPALNVAFAINTYCGTHENSPRFTCAGCHVGNGRFPKTPTEMAALPLADQRTELANIDCLMCHQETYKRFPDWLTSNDNPLGTSEGFAPLVLQNVTTDAAGEPRSLDRQHRHPHRVCRHSERQRAHAGLPVPARLAPRQRLAASRRHSCQLRRHGTDHRGRPRKGCIAPRVTPA